MSTDAPLSPPRRRAVTAEVILALLALLFLWPFGVMLSTSVRSDAHRVAHRSEWLPRAEYIQRPGGKDREVLQAEDLAGEGKPGQVRVHLGDWTGRVDKTVVVPSEQILTRTGPTFRPYFHGLGADGFGRHAWITLLLCVVTVLVSTFTSALVAYSFSVLRWPGRDRVFYVVLGTLTVPTVLTMVPTFDLYDALGWTGSYVPLVLPAFFGNVFFIFLLRQFFLKVPRDLIDAARLEGSSDWRVFTGVVLPSSWPVLTVVAVLGFVWQWGELLTPLIYAAGTMKDTFSEGLAHLQRFSPRLHGELMAMSAVSIIPVALVVFLTRRAWTAGLRALLPARLPP